MNTLTFDTLKFANRMKAAGMDPKLAEAEAEALSEVLEVNLKDLATKNDIASIKEDLKEMETRLDLKFDAKLAETKSELIRWVVAVGLLQTALIVGIVMKAAHLL